MQKNLDGRQITLILFIWIKALAENNKLINNKRVTLEKLQDFRSDLLGYQLPSTFRISNFFTLSAPEVVSKKYFSPKKEQSSRLDQVNYLRYNLVVHLLTGILIVPSLPTIKKNLDKTRFMKNLGSRTTTQEVDHLCWNE